jgi:oligoribonuclease NrnB/cAMP/cGMP phosphodiesterase (DHH superfamily)
MKKILVVYHADCPDGFGAAWVVWKKFGKKAEYIATDPRKLPEKEIKNKEIYILDNSISGSDLKKLLAAKNRVVIIDHHKSSEADVKRSPEYVFDINHSGAVLTWHYFYPKKKAPLFLKHVEAIDLWKFDRRVLEITAYTHMQQYDFEVWSKMVKDLESTKKTKEYQKLGKAILACEDAMVEKVIKKSELVSFAGHKALAVNSSLKDLSSIIGQTLRKKLPPIGIVWYKEGDLLSVSLRGDGTIDVSQIAKKYGGGGHPNAAGFELPWTGKFPWKKIK